MKLLFDENLSRNVSRRLREVFPGSLHVADLGMLGADDESVWKAARADGFVIITKDKHFPARSFVMRDAPKVVWLCIGNVSVGEIERCIRENSGAIQAFGDQTRSILLIVRG